MSFQLIIRSSNLYMLHQVFVKLVRDKYLMLHVQI
jgi:hypothetical protein